MNKPGISPQERNVLENMGRAMGGDMKFSVYPETAAHACGTDGYTAGWTRDVQIRLESNAGDLHEWYVGNLTISIADDSTLGAATVSPTEAYFENGAATLIVTGDTNSWVAGETDTLSFDDQTIMGYTVSGKTSVQTAI